jgi:hypothetical protein
MNYDTDSTRKFFSSPKLPSDNKHLIPSAKFKNKDDKPKITFVSGKAYMKEQGGMDAEIRVSNLKGTCNKIAVIQAFWGEPNEALRSFYKNDELTRHQKLHTLPINNTEMHAFIEEGPNSPTVFKKKEKTPYIFESYEFDEDKKSWTVYLDDPVSIFGYYNGDVFFEDVIVAVNYNNTGKDKVVGVLEWGFNMAPGSKTYSQLYKNGIKKKHSYQLIDRKTTTPTEYSAKNTGFRKRDKPSEAFKQILKNDYPEYEIEY